MALGVVTTLLLAWVAAPLAVHFGWMSLHGFGPGTYYAKPGRAGHYLHARAPLADFVRSGRIIYVGSIEEKEYWGRDLPRPWAAWNTTSMEEGYEVASTVAQGWPWRALSGVRWDSTRPERPLPTRTDGLVVLAEGKDGPVAIPLRPHWPGLLADVAVFSAGWAGLLVLPRAWVHRRRARRGWCVECGYDRAGLVQGAVCPECGPWRARRRAGCRAVMAGALVLGLATVVSMAWWGPGRVWQAEGRADGGYDSDGDSAHAARARPRPDSPPFFARWSFHERGWPLPAWWSWRERSFDPGAGQVVAAWGGSLDFGRPPAELERVPILPAWSGLAVDLALFTLLWGVLIAVCRAGARRVCCRANPREDPT